VVPAESVEEGADEIWMAEAVALGQSVRATTSPNPWVGAVVVPADDSPVALGATSPPGGPHAEANALALAGPCARGATVYVTLEPCSHHGRTPPCADALIAAGVARVVVGVVDPDPQVAGQGIARLQEAGVSVSVGVGAAAVEESLRPYLKQRRTGRPWVVLKLAATLDGRTAAPDGSSKWITGPLARADVHRLRAESDAIAVGAGTIRQDDPTLTVRDAPGFDPLRIVLGSAPAEARVQPARQFAGDPSDLVDTLGGEGVIQLLVEGGATVAGDWHRRGLVDQYVLYLAPALMGGDGGRPILAGPSISSISDLWRGRIVSVRQIGPDVRIDLLADPEGDAVP
jgi:diaminohydroxyphosphoribosylaminopyrimidine deaminase/5-amino-6-(5-phosphoribosylamino)uracil reductase